MGFLDLGSRPKVEKAVLKVIEGNPRKGKELKFDFNPENYSVKGGAKWDRTHSAAAETCPPAHYGGAQHLSLSLSNVLFDESETADGDVSRHVDILLDWCKPTPDSLQSGKNPWGPFLEFSWGSNKQLGKFKCVLTSVSAQYTMFRSDGTPVRAMVGLTLEELPDDAKRQNPTSGAIHGRSTRVLREGDSLQSVSFENYGTPNLWRALAVYNEIDDPLRLDPGTSLIIPSPAEANRMAGSREAV